MKQRDAPLWTDPPKRPTAGEVRRALDREIKRAEAEGTVFLEPEKAALRRQANDLDRLEAAAAERAAAGEVKPWDYTPKTQAAQAFHDACRRFFGTTDDEVDPFVAALRALEDEAARAGAAAPLDPQESRPAD